MSQSGKATQRRIARLLRRCLEDGHSVEIDGLGIFRPGGERGFEFLPNTKPKVFMAYVEEDLPQVERLYQQLADGGFDPWLDKKKLLPGQNWPRSIEQTIGVSDFFLACFSERAAAKRGHFNAELRYALDCAARLPLDEIYFIPARLNACEVPARITQAIQYVDLFPDWEQGVDRILSAMRRQMKRRRLNELRLAG